MFDVIKSYSDNFGISETPSHLEDPLRRLSMVVSTSEGLSSFIPIDDLFCSIKKHYPRGLKAESEVALIKGLSQILKDLGKEAYAGIKALEQILNANPDEFFPNFEKFLRFTHHPAREYKGRTVGFEVELFCGNFDISEEFEVRPGPYCSLKDAMPALVLGQELTQTIPDNANSTLHVNLGLNPKQLKNYQDNTKHIDYVMRSLTLLAISKHRIRMALWTVAGKIHEFDFTPIENQIARLEYPGFDLRAESHVPMIGLAIAAGWKMLDQPETALHLQTILDSRLPDLRRFIFNRCFIKDGPYTTFNTFDDSFFTFAANMPPSASEDQMFADISLQRRTLFHEIRAALYPSRSIHPRQKMETLAAQTPG